MTAYLINRIFLTMGGSSSSPRRETRPVEPLKETRPVEPWRKTKRFKEKLGVLVRAGGRLVLREMEATQLRKELGKYRNTELKITLVGHSRTGKSSLINSIFSISKGRIANVTLTRSGTVRGVGTHYFTGIAAREDDLFQAISFFDTMGFVSSERDDFGIRNDDLKACLDGRLRVGHKFNEDKILPEAEIKNRPHCVLLVVSAEELDVFEPSHRHHDKLREVETFIPEDVARIAVITKVDVICRDSKKNVELIYKSQEVQRLVRKAQAILGVQENHVFPIINFLNEMEVNEEKSVPIMFLLKFAFAFAQDRKDYNTTKINLLS